MAARRHNLTRRALLGAGVGACALGGEAAVRAAVGVAAGAPGPAPVGVSLSSPPSSIPSRPASGGKETLRQAQGERCEGDRGKAILRTRWVRTLAAYRRSEARFAAFQAQVALLPEARRAFPACRPLETRFGDLDDRRFATLRRPLRIPAPDLAALSLKLDLAVADQAWELTGAEHCLAVIAADARRLAEALSRF